MGNLKETLNKKIAYSELEEDLKNSLKDKEFALLVKELKLDKNTAMKKVSKLKEVIEEKKNCFNCKGIYMCKNSYQAHFLNAIIMDNRLYFTYVPCKYQKEVLKFNEKKVIRMKDIDTNDKKQLDIIKWMDNFYEDYTPTLEMKGLFLHGSFGSGKTYLLSALLNELNISKKVSIEIVYFPEALRSIKEDFDLFSYKMDKFMNTDILLIDDIGAEKVTEWGRDEVLGTILQYRMDNKKTTFFTSNLTINELEEHLSLTKSSIDKVKSRRIIERIKQLTIDKELISENRRG